MTLKEAIALIEERLVFVEPSAEVRKQISITTSRTYNLSNLKSKDGKCAWCQEGKLPTKRHKYCSTACSNSAFYYCNPQHPSAKGYVFVELQDGACKACGISHEELVISKVKARLALKERLSKTYGDNVKVSYYTIVNNTGHIIQVDHKVPIFKGGASVGLDNIQVICASCHYEKTAAERKL